MVNLICPKSCLVRVDGSGILGFGHIMRTIGIAQALKKNNISSLFVVKDFNPKITKVIQSYGFKVKLIPATSNYFQDAEITTNYAYQYNASFILIDLSNSNVLTDLGGYKRYIKALKKTGKYLISIDGYGSECIARKIFLPFDIIIIPYYGVKKYSYKINHHTKLFLGPKYFVLRQAFINTINKQKDFNKTQKNILICLSKTASNKLLNKIKMALEGIKPHTINYKFIFDLNDIELVKLFKWADIAITNSGLIRYETAFMGLPSIVISINSNHESIMKEYQKSGACLYVGPENQVTTSAIMGAINSLLRDSELNHRLVNQGQKMIDGLGGKRLTYSIIKLLKKKT
jgi:spore coat polysaccharide biosynthesis predicted glycosyltransferase SpsG